MLGNRPRNACLLFVQGYRVALCAICTYIITIANLTFHDLTVAACALAPPIIVYFCVTEELFMKSKGATIDYYCYTPWTDSSATVHVRCISQGFYPKLKVCPSQGSNMFGVGNP